MIGCQLFIYRTLIGDGAFGESVSQVVLDDLLYGHLRIKTETQDIVQVGSADGVQDTEFLGTNHSTTCQVSTYREQLTKGFGVLSIQHVIKDECSGIFVFCSCIHLESVFYEFTFELGANCRRFTEWPIDLTVRRSRHHNGGLVFEPTLPQPNHSGGLTTPCTSY